MHVDLVGTLLLGLLIFIMIRGLIDNWFGGGSSTDTANATSSAIPSSPPGRSTFRTSISSYFLPPSTFSHTRLTLSQTRVLLSRKLPSELIPIVLDAGGDELLVCSEVQRSDLVVYDDSDRGRHGRGSAQAYWRGSELEGQEWLYVASERVPGRVVKVKKPSELDRLEEEGEAEKATVQTDHDHDHDHDQDHDQDHDTSPQSPWRIKKIIVETLSSDQGWTSMPIPVDAGEYDHSYTWFELGVSHPDGSMEPYYLPIQRNARAIRSPRKHVVEVKLWEELVQSLRHGDRLCLRARASFLGWQNRVHEASIRILYGF